MVDYLGQISGFQISQKDIHEKVKQVGKNLIDILPVIEFCSDAKTDKDSIIPFAKSKVDLLFLISEDDGVTTSVDQVNFYLEYHHHSNINKTAMYDIFAAMTS